MLGDSCPIRRSHCQRQGWGLGGPPRIVSGSVATGMGSWPGLRVARARQVLPAPSECFFGSPRPRWAADWSGEPSGAPPQQSTRPCGCKSMRRPSGSGLRCVAPQGRGWSRTAANGTCSTAPTSPPPFTYCGCAWMGYGGPRDGGRQPRDEPTAGNVSAAPTGGWPGHGLPRPPATLGSASAGIAYLKALGKWAMGPRLLRPSSAQTTP